MNENMIKFSIKKKHVKIFIMLFILSITIVISYAFLGDYIMTSNSSNVGISGTTSKSSNFIEGDPINIVITEENFNKGHGNLEGETTSSVVLKASNDNELTTLDYYVYFDISNNTYKYTTVEKKPEILLQITDPEGNLVCSETVLNEVCTSIKLDSEANTSIRWVESTTNKKNEDGSITQEIVRGLDVTEVSGFITIDENYNISTTNSVDGIKQDWTAKIVFVNLDDDQSESEGSKFDANLVLTGYQFIEEMTEFYFTGNIESYTVENSGYYQIELWGASGTDISIYKGGSGAYTSGNVFLEENETLYFNVGSSLSYNGGGDGAYDGFGEPGGGATDVRLIGGLWNDFNSLSSRIMVAAGGGGANNRGSGYGDGDGGSGGGLIGYNGQVVNFTNTSYGMQFHYGATQVAGGYSTLTVSGSSSITTNDSSFGHAGLSANQSGGGGGYYGGANGGHAGAAGGSSFISGHTGSVAITSESDRTPKLGCDTGTTNNLCSIHYLNIHFRSTVMIDGEGYNWTNVIGEQKQMPNPIGGYYELGEGHTGNGYARITRLY